MTGAVIFDCDGGLVDSEVISAVVEVELFAEYGVAITVEDIYDRCVGLSKASVAEALRRDWGVDLPEEYFAKRRDLVAARFATGGRAVPGIVAVLGGLATRHVAMAVASSSTPGSIARKLDVTGLTDYFGSHVYSATLVEHGKPAPDLFLHAATQLGVDPGDCVVIEDARPGVNAGVSAGMRVIGFTAAGHCGPDHADRLTQAGAHAIAATGDQLAAALARF